MAETRLRSFITLCFLYTFLHTTGGVCKIPKHYWGSWFSIVQGNELNTLINEDLLENEIFSGNCHDLHINNSTYRETADGKYHASVLLHSSASGCYVCWKILYRTPNVLQYRISSCHTRKSGFGVPTMDTVCGDILPQTELLTLFKQNLDTINCKQTFEGVYHFSYEVDYGGGGICDSQASHVIACQQPGSPYVDNQVFNMNFGKCPFVTSSRVQRIRFQCMGSWQDEQGNIWSAMADLGEEVWRERFRCMLTRNDQQLSDNTRRHTLSRWAECSTLKSPYDGDIRLVLRPALSNDNRFFVYGSQLVEPACNLPRNFTGSWFTTGEFDTEVSINATHIYYKTKIDEFTYRETYFTCQQNRDSRYLMTAVTVGKCEVDYVCFDFQPRHHNIVRWRMGKPYRMSLDELAAPDFLVRKFRQACSWYSFTLDRMETEWTYNIYILHPPSPVDCPIAGRYAFKQIGAEPEKFITRVQGITERPRHQIGCREYTSEFKSCATNSKKISVDIEYCNTVDHTGKPIGEYDIADRVLTCVGFWMEDMRSYMITYDEEDAVSRYRCWVYERLDWRDVILSRATRAVCGKMQTPRSFTPDEGASLALELKESEREDDDCPQRYNDGKDPYSTELKVYVLGHSSALRVGALIVIASSMMALAAQIC